VSKEIKTNEWEKKLKSERHACVCRSSVCIEAAREDFFLKKQMAGQWAGKVQIKGIPSAQRTQKNVSHTPSTNLSPSKKKTQHKSLEQLAASGIQMKVINTKTSERHLEILFFRHE